MVVARRGFALSFALALSSSFFHTLSNSLTRFRVSSLYTMCVYVYICVYTLYISRFFFFSPFRSPSLDIFLFPPRG